MGSPSVIDRIGRYKVLSELGRGAMGIVYKAQDPTIGRLVAIKTIRLGELAQPEEREQLRNRLFREAQSAGILSHPGIVTIYDIAEEKDLAYITMEFVEGQTLEKMLDSGLVEDAKYLVSIATQTAVALDYAHNKGIIHRDIKPGNIMVNTESLVKITDFGIARIASSKFTQTGTVMGTPSYMSPEQVRGAVVDGRSDMFSLAVVLYEMLTGQKPFSGDSITTVIFKIVSENPAPPKDLNPSVGNKVNAVVMRALAKEPAERFQSCKEFAEALQLAVEQTANLTPTVRKIVVSSVGIEASDPAIATQPARPAAPPREPPSQPAEPAPAAAAPPPPVAEVPPVAAATAPPPPAAEKPPLPEKKLPPLEAKQAAPSPLAATVVREPPPRRRTGLTVALAAAVVLIVVGVFSQKRRAPAPPEVKVAPAVPATQAPSTAPAPTPSAAPPVQQEEAPKKTPPPEAPSNTAPSTRPAVREPAPKAAAAPRVINVVTTEPGARVMVDGNSDTACTTPCSTPVSPGRRNLLFTQPGFFPERREVMVAGEPVEVRVTMRAILGTVMLSSSPAGATITVDGKAVEGETPKALKLSLGRHVIVVIKEGAGSAEYTVEITDDGLVPVRLTLQPN